MIIGYTTGVFDLFHIGHLNLLRNAKSLCDYLIVGVTTDELAQSKKYKKPYISFSDRIEIVRGCRYVDSAIPQYNMDKVTACLKIHANIVFVGDDWFGSDIWLNNEAELKKHGIDVLYLPYTKNVSSTLIKSTLSYFNDSK